DAVPLVADDDALVPRDGTPAHRSQATAGAVPELGDRRAASVEDPHRAVACVAVLAVRHREELLVGGEEPDLRRLPVRVQPFRAAFGDEVDRGALVARATHERKACA